MQLLSWLADLIDGLYLLASAANRLSRHGRPGARSRATAQPRAAMSPPPSPATTGSLVRGGGVAGWAEPTPVAVARVDGIGCSMVLAVIVAFVGPLFAVFTTMGGPDLVIPITVGSCTVAGLLFAVGLRGIRGAIAVLVIPLVWAVPASLIVISMWTGGSFEPGEEIEGASPLALFVLVVGASTEAGYLAGRLVARFAATLANVRDANPSINGRPGGGWSPDHRE